MKTAFQKLDKIIVHPITILWYILKTASKKMSAFDTIKRKDLIRFLRKTALEGPNF